MNISPECRSHAVCEAPERIAEVQGKAGTVVAWGQYDGRQGEVTARYPGHMYMVLIDEKPHELLIVAASELEPLAVPA